MTRHVWHLWGLHVCKPAWSLILGTSNQRISKLIESIRDPRFEPFADERSTSRPVRHAPAHERVDAWFLWLYQNLAQDEPKEEADDPEMPMAAMM